MTAIFTTPPLSIIDRPADANHYGGVRVGYRYIALHATGGTWSLPWLTTTSPLSNPVSVHRLIEKDGTLYKLVQDEDVAWHAGYGVIGAIGPNAIVNFNKVSLGIELENMDDFKDPYPEAQLWSCAGQVIEWWGRYGWLPILSHASVDIRKQDPAGFPWQHFHEIVKQRLGLVLTQVKP
jgi:N-acetylmuramoyl-L-alanine amidase